MVNTQDIVPHLPACQKNNTLGIPDNQSKPCDQIAIEKPYHHGVEIWLVKLGLEGASGVK